MNWFIRQGGIQKLQNLFDELWKKVKDNAPDFAYSGDIAETPKEIWTDLRIYMDFIKKTTLDLFWYSTVWTRYHHYCGFHSKVGKQDIYINAPWSCGQGALSAIRALILFFQGCNVGLLILERTFYNK